MRRSHGDFENIPKIYLVMNGFSAPSDGSLGLVALNGSCFKSNRRYQLDLEQRLQL